ncbi:MAG: hypothetical protein QM766_05390 [Burkholderiaceae bacterium]
MTFIPPRSARLPSPRSALRPAVTAALLALAASGQAQTQAPARAPAGCAAPAAAPAPQTLSTITDGFAVRTGPSPQPNTRWRVAFQGGVEWPHVILRPTRGPWDLSRHGALLLPITNVGEQDVIVNLRVGDDDGATWPDHAGAARIPLAPFERRNVLLPLCAVDPRAMGMRAGPPVRPSQALPPVLMRGLTPLALDGRLDPRRVASVFIVVDGRSSAHQLILGDLQAVAVPQGAAAYDGLFDTFGQTTIGQWPEKIKDEADLKARADEELAKRLSDAPRDGDPSRAAATGVPAVPGAKPPRFPASGFFRTQRGDDGRWWLVTPQGEGFFSIGVDTVTWPDMGTYVEGRESMFVDLPAADGPLAAHLGEADLRRDMGAQAGQRFNHGRFFNFYTANLQRRYGPDYAQTWQRMTLQRLRDWGFNTLGNWSHPDLWRPERAERLPYTVPLSIEGDFARVSDGTDYWGKMPDPFDPRFAQAVDQLMQEQAAPRRDDPMLLGYFVDNELAWGNGRAPELAQRYALAVHTLALTGASPAKQAFIAMLREHHASPADWAQAWKLDGAAAGDAAAAPSGPASAPATPAAAPSPSSPPGWPRDWDAALRAPVRLPAMLHDAAAADLSAFTRQFADTYYRTVAEALKRHDPNHLYLGSRFAAQTDEAVGACDRYCDVVSFNIYHRQFAPARQDRFRELVKPALVGEFNFSSTDRGPFWPGLVDVGSEAARGRAYGEYVAAAAADPQIVGVHWFQYVDQPASGRLLDGENAHFGLVGITDVPWQSFTQAVSDANVAALKARMSGKPK